MNSNMTLDDLLIELGRWGIVELKYIHNSWNCELRIPGYLGENLPSYVKGKGNTPRSCIEDAWSNLEKWQSSGQMAKDRERYLSQYNAYKARYDNATTYQRMGFDPIRDPGKMEPERPLPPD